MGFLNKITRPISRVLDKIVPNEIKPALPFLAAAAPFMAPGIMGIGGNTMLSRALMSGGLNLGAQLAQEGSEGDFNALSLALASGIGALSAPNAGAKIRGIDPNFVGPQPAAEGIVGQGREFLAKSADFLGPQTGGVTDILGKGGTKAGFDMATAKAASIPLTQGTMDLGFAEARRAANDVVDDALAGIGEGASDADRALAIRQSMEAYGFTEDEIVDTISAAGYRAGGRVGFDNGGDVEKELDTVLVMIEGPDGVEVKEVLKSEALRENLKIVSDTGEFNQYRFDNVENKKAGGRVGFQGGGMDAREMNISEPGIMGNPAVMEKIENMREFMIANPDIEDITDYSEKYESEDPEFEGIKGAMKKINEDEINEEKEILEDNNMFSNLINKVSSVFVDEKGDYRSGLQKAKFVLSDFIAGKGYDFVTGAEWYNKLDDETQKEILLMKQKIRDNPERYGFSTRMKELTEQPVYDEEFAGKFGYGSRYANGGRINAEEGGLMNLGGKEMDLRKGGFVPIGKKERADDVPARLSKNEFVMTADAVRAAGGGSVNKGAKRMYDVMNKLEARA